MPDPISSSRSPRSPTGDAGSAPKPAADQAATTTEVALPALPTVADTTRTGVEEKAAKALLGVVEQLKDVAGHGQESAGQGDARVTERRHAVSILLADRSGEQLGKLKAMGSKNIDQDIAFVEEAQRKDYTPDDKGQFSWSKSLMSGKTALQWEHEKRVREGRVRAADFDSGKAAIFDAANNSVVGLAFLTDPTALTKGLADTLLQFRARSDAAGAPTSRIDLTGPAMVAEQNILVASAKLDAANDGSVRDYALLRELIASHPASSVNSLFEARNAVGKIQMDSSNDAKGKWGSKDHPTAWIRWETPSGATASPYASIHHNFSRDTPDNIAAFVNEWMFPVGPAEHRGEVFTKVVIAMRLARAGDVDGARISLAGLMRVANDSLRPLMTTIAGLPQPPPASQLADAIRDFLKSSCVKDLGNDVEANLIAAATVYQKVVLDQPTVASLALELFKAGDATAACVNVLARMEQGNDLGALQELGAARLAMRDAIFATPKGYERHEMILLDAKLARLTNEFLGASVDRVGDLKEPAQRGEALLGLQAALRSALASGLHTLKLDGDAAAKRGRPLPDVLNDVDALLGQVGPDGKGKVATDAFRAIMCDAHVAVARTVQNARAFFDERRAALAVEGIPVDHEFSDQFIKQSALHYATAITEKGMRFGLVEKITPRRIENVEGMRVLNGIGPVVFSGVVFAENSKELQKLGVGKDQLAVLHHLEEKKMVAVGGMFVDTAHAPGGNSHLNMYAMNNGIPVVALPELRTKYAEFFENAAKEGGVYVDDSDGYEMMTVRAAIEAGLIPVDDPNDPAQLKAAIDKLRPGMNRKISILKPTTDGQAFEVVARHEAMINDQRPTREVELYVPQDEVRGVGRGAPTFAELAPLGIHARHLAGEKGTVLALLKAHPALGKFVPDGSVVSPGDIKDLLTSATTPEGTTLQALWDSVWSNDPKVGVVHDGNFLESAFYSDSGYRRAKREELQTKTREHLTTLLVDKAPDGSDRLTAAGQKLYDQLLRNPALAASDSWIARSSFTGEDRPGKSGAGQYESFPALKDPVSRIKGVIGVVESTWMPEPIENNVAEQFFLRHIGPTVIMQHCLDPDISGVVISRDTETGARGEVTAQLVKGFGGGVDGGKTTEGVIGESGTRVSITNGVAGRADGVDVGGVAVSDADMKTLRELVLQTEQYFHEVVEKNKGYAVDMEVARVGGRWQIVQARVILIDE